MDKKKLKAKLKKAGRSLRKATKEFGEATKKGVKEAQRGAKKVVGAWEKARDIATEAERRRVFDTELMVWGEPAQRVESEPPTEVSQKPATVVVVTKDIGDVRDLLGLGEKSVEVKKKKKKKREGMSSYILG